MSTKQQQKEFSRKTGGDQTLVPQTNSKLQQQISETSYLQQQQQQHSPPTSQNSSNSNIISIKQLNLMVVQALCCILKLEVHLHHQWLVISPYQQRLLLLVSKFSVSVHLWIASTRIFIKTNQMYLYQRQQQQQQQHQQHQQPQSQQMSQISQLSQQIPPQGSSKIS